MTVAAGWRAPTRAAKGEPRASSHASSRAKLGPRSIAFFDFDNTLIHGDVGLLFGRDLYSKGRARRTRGGRVALFLRHLPYLTGMALQASLYKLHARRRSSLVRSSYKGLRGIDAAEFYAAMDAFSHDQVAPRIYPDMAERIRRHVAQGTQCVIVTTGIEPLVAHCVRHLPDPVEVIGCTLLEKEGRLTGKVEGPLFGLDKANILKAYCKAQRVDPGEIEIQHARQFR